MERAFKGKTRLCRAFLFFPGKYPTIDIREKDGHLNFSQHYFTIVGAGMP